MGAGDALPTWPFTKCPVSPRRKLHYSVMRIPLRTARYPCATRGGFPRAAFLFYSAYIALRLDNSSD